MLFYNLSNTKTLYDKSLCIGLKQLGHLEKATTKDGLLFPLVEDFSMYDGVKTTRFCRCISSFDKREARYAIEYDASLNIFEILVYQRKVEF